MALFRLNFVVKFHRAHFMNYAKLSSQELLKECVTRAGAEAWEEFVRRFQPLIAGVVARTAMRWTDVSASLVDDLVQETYLKLCTEEFRRLREFESRFEDAIYGFLKAVAYNVTMDHFKVQHATKRGAQLLSKAEFDTALQTVPQESSVEDQVLLHEIEDMVAQITDTDRDKLVFLLYYRQGFTAKAIAEMPGIELSEKGVESCLLRLTRQLRNHIVGSAKE
jgi:RNA polymerase sigma-70 factor (ECF subfamily)